MALPVWHYGTTALPVALPVWRYGTAGMALALKPRRTLACAHPTPLPGSDVFLAGFDDHQACCG